MMTSKQFNALCIPCQNKVAQWYSGLEAISRTNPYIAQRLQEISKNGIVTMLDVAVLVCEIVDDSQEQMEIL